MCAGIQQGSSLFSCLSWLKSLTLKPPFTISLKWRIRSVQIITIRAIILCSSFKTPFAPHNAGLQTTHWGLCSYFLWAKPCRGGLRLRTGSMWGIKQLSSGASVVQVGGSGPAPHNLPFRPRGKKMLRETGGDLDSRPDRRIQTRWGGAEACSGQGDQRGRLLWGPCTAMGFAHSCALKTHMNFQIFA